MENASNTLERRYSCSPEVAQTPTRYCWAAFIKLDSGCPSANTGSPVATLWALGYLVEGAHYYTHALPRPQLPSRQVLDAQRCVSAMFAAIPDDPRRAARRRPDAASATA